MIEIFFKINWCLAKYVLILFIMKSHQTITVHTDTLEQTNALLAFVKSLRVKFELSEKEYVYNSDFISKVEEGKRAIESGKGEKISMDELERLWK